MPRRSAKGKAKRESKTRGPIPLQAIAFSTHAWEEFCYWQEADATIARRVRALIEECRRTPFEGTGKPEPLRGSLSGFWSRRITREHRLVYRVEAGVLEIAQCRYHY